METIQFQIDRVQSVSEQLAESIGNLMKQLNPEIIPPSTDELQSIINSENTYLFVIQDLDKKLIVGTLTLITYATPSGSRGYIEDVVVDDQYRGKGLGVLLMNKGISTARDLNLEYVGLTSRPERDAANKLYLKLGFQKRNTNVYRLMLHSE